MIRELRQLKSHKELVRSIFRRQRNVAQRVWQMGGKLIEATFAA
jgi:hypothetical protein